MTVLTTREQPPQIVRAPAAAAPRSPASAAATGLTGRDFLRILRRRKWLILLTLVITAGLFCVGTWLWLEYAPFYLADAYIEINPPRGVFTDTQFPAQEAMDRLVMQQAALILGPAVMEKACDDTRVRNTDWFRQHAYEAPQRLEKDLSIAPVPKTNLIRISMILRNKKDLPEIVNTVANKATELAQAMLTGDRGQELDELAKKVEVQNKQLNTLRSEDAALVASSPDASMHNLSNELALQLQSLLPDYNKLVTEKDEIDSQYREMSEAAKVPGQLENSVMIQMIVREDRMVQSLDQGEKSVAIELEDAVRRFGPGHLTVQKIEGKLAGIRKQKQELEKSLATQAASEQLMRLDMGRKAKTMAMLNKKDQIERLQSELRDIKTNLAVSSARHDSNLKEIDREQKEVDKWEARRSELQSQLRMQPPAQLRRMAIVPREVYFPQWKVMAPAGCMLGLLLGVVLAVALELMDTSIKSPSDVSRRVDLPLLGMIPHADDIDDEIPDLRLAYASHPSSLIGEAFRQIRTCLMFSGPAEHRRSLLVTSPMPEDGRSTVALNLAAAMARGGRKVLVVDANFRQPALRALFPQAGESGLSSALVGQAKWQDTICQIEPGLSLMPAGPLPPNPADLLGSEQMRQLMAELTSQYDQVIFDGAPCMIVSDAAVLATVVDGVILTVRAGSNTYGIVQRSRDTLAKVGARILGVVLNGVRVTAGGYLRKNYETFYEYHTQAQLPSK